MKFLYDFGISQDDPNVEGKLLSPENADMLCIASGGEVPLSILAEFNTRIKALDFSPNQIRLCQLKMAAILCLKPVEAAIFLGYKIDQKNNWTKYFQKVQTMISREDAEFWEINKSRIRKGPVRCSRFELYLSFFCRIVSSILGKKRLWRLFEMDSKESQLTYFDNYLDRRIIFLIFRIAFSPLLYKKRGLSPQALIHQKGNDMALMFYHRFRDFFTTSPARLNYYLQFYFFGEVIFDEALPVFLNPSGSENIRDRHHHLSFEVKSIEDEIAGSSRLYYSSYALSNISDWMPVDTMNNLLAEILLKSEVKFNMLLRFIHKNPVNKNIRDKGYHFEAVSNEEVASLDRFPFYSYLKAQGIK